MPILVAAVMGGGEESRFARFPPDNFFNSMDHFETLKNVNDDDDTMLVT